jgi:isopentenyl-diphosphate Delta-isomerase
MSLETIYFVDKNDQPTGKTQEKLTAHHSNTELHAAFSCYVFNENGKFLVTQRAHTKKVWHGVWTNSCCGHPFPEETRVDAINRRIQYELGMTVGSIKLIMPKYIYKTPLYGGIIEHEFCPVYVAIASSEPNPNPDEVEDFKWVDWEWYKSELENDSTDYSVFKDSIPADSELGKNHIPKWSWWCKDQLELINSNKDFQDFLNNF